jgi:hypothetical protein
MDWLGNNKDGLAAIGGLASTYAGYTSAKAQQDYAKSLLNMQQDSYNRAIADKQKQEDNMSAGFTAGFAG